MRFHYAIHPHSKPWWESDIARKALVYNTSLEAIPVKGIPERRRRGFIGVDGKNILFSAAYVDREKLYLRIYNPSAQAECAVVKIGDPDIRMLNAILVDLRHRALKNIDVQNGSLQVQVGPKKIVTLELDVVAGK